MATVFEEAREVPVSEEFEVIVCGSGPAGVAAALASARAGAKTCLIELKGCLGGTWTAGLLGWIIDHKNKGGIMHELREDILRISGDHQPPLNESLPFNIEDMKLLLEEKCLEAGVHIRLHTRVVGANVDGGKISHIITESKSGREAWAAKVFIDATGDGDLGKVAGCEFSLGKPENGQMQPMSLLCLITGLKLDEIKDVTSGYADWAQSKKDLVDEMVRGGCEPTYAFPTIFHLGGELYLFMGNHQYNVSALSAEDVTKATLNARKQIHQQLSALKSLGGRWEGLRIVATGEQIGTREGRRIRGLYELTVDDLVAGREFEDGICKCTFCIDVHATDPKKGKGIESNPKVKPYDIPLRSLISKDVDNLMMAGRCISGDFLAHASYRVTGNAAVTGEAAGVCASISAQNNQLPRDTDYHAVLKILKQG